MVKIGDLFWAKTDTRQNILVMVYSINNGIALIYPKNTNFGGSFAIDGRGLRFVATTR